MSETATVHTLVARVWKLDARVEALEKLVAQLVEARAEEGSES